MNPIQAARAAGQQIWLDNLSRSLINEGHLARHIEQGVAGVTTNPAIFHKAIAEGQDYRPALDAMRNENLSAEQRYERLVIDDVQRACDLMRPVFDASGGDAGYVSLEVSPSLADDEAGTVAAARRLRAAVARDNLLVKIPATAAGIRAIDLTPAAVGPGVIPPANLRAHLDAPNVNMVTCGGQATIPMVAAISRVQPVAYGEIVATVSSKSAGPGTRKNIDEFTRTTAGAVEKVGGAKKGKAIIIINPAEPPLMMRDTVHCLTEGEPQQDAIRESIAEMIKEVQKYVPGYRLVNGPVFDGNRVSVYLEVEGLGDYLPKYAGNLDIMTAAAARTAEMFAEEILAGRIQLNAVEIA